MKRSVFFLAIAVMGLVLSCEKDSLTGFSNEELTLRSAPEYNGVDNPEMKKIEAEYQLVRVEALPDEAGLEGLRPPPGAELALYSMKGKASLLGALEPGMSYEAHYLPPDGIPGKEKLEVLVWGRFWSSRHHDGLYYAGTCIYHLDGSREAHYEFYTGSGRFEASYGWMAGAGHAWDGGERMKFMVRGEVYMPARNREVGVVR